MLLAENYLTTLQDVDMNVCLGVSVLIVYYLLKEALCFLYIIHYSIISNFYPKYYVDDNALQLIQVLSLCAPVNEMGWSYITCSADEDNQIPVKTIHAN